MRRAWSEGAECKLANVSRIHPVSQMYPTVGLLMLGALGPLTEANVYFVCSVSLGDWHIGYSFGAAICSWRVVSLSTAPPVWVDMPKDSHLEEGKPGYLHCHAQANLQPEVTWFRSSNIIQPEVGFHIPHCLFLLTTYRRKLVCLCLHSFTKTFFVCFFCLTRTSGLRYSLTGPSGSTMWRSMMRMCTAVKPKLWVDSWRDMLRSLCSVRCVGIT